VLLKGGVPFHIAFPGATWLTASESHALAVVLLELEGATFNWDSMSWVER